VPCTLFEEMPLARWLLGNSHDKGLRVSGSLHVSTRHQIPDDVGITLWVTNIMLPPMAQPEAHEDHLLTKVGRYVGSEEGFLMNKARRR
jgi:hypothetical protein